MNPPDSGFIRRLGADLGSTLRKGNWVFQGLTGTEDERIDAEFEFGRDLAANIGIPRKTPTTTEDHAQAQELKELGKLLAAHLVNKRRRFDFTIVDSGPPNAFALPGGFIFIEQSLLQFCGGDRNLVGFILGHEIGHVIRGHAFQKVASKALINGLGRFLIPARGHLGAVVQQVARQFLENAYSREQELDADKFGKLLAQAAGLDPKGGIRFFQRLLDRGPTPNQTGPPAYFASHPPVTERIANIR
jgi:predicted Zn-dependent protease